MILLALGSPAVAFETLGYGSGQRLDDIVRLAQQQNHPIGPSSRLTARGHYNHQVATQEWGHHTKYSSYYSVMDQPATILLRFTPVSFRLYDLQMHWRIAGAPGERQAVYDGLKAALDFKYGGAAHRCDVSSTLVAFATGTQVVCWKPDARTRVQLLLRPLGGPVLHFTDPVWAQQVALEEATLPEERVAGPDPGPRPAPENL